MEKQASPKHSKTISSKTKNDKVEVYEGFSTGFLYNPMWGSGFRVWVWDLGFRACSLGSGFRVFGLGFRIQGLGLRKSGKWITKKTAHLLVTSVLPSCTRKAGVPETREVGSGSRFQVSACMVCN